MTSVSTPNNGRAGLSDIRLGAIPVRGWFRVPWKLIAPGLDWLTGIRRVRRAYQKIVQQLRGEGLDPARMEPGELAAAFVRQTIRVLGIEYSIDEASRRRIPARGPVLLTCNHPLGGFEGIIFAEILRQVRPDSKILANFMLGTIREMRDLFIFTNPLKTKNPRNIGPVREAIQYLKEGHLVFIFPAGRVSFYQPDKGRVTDGDWTPVAARLQSASGAPVLPVHISGESGWWFQFLGRIWYRFRLLLLPRQLFKMRGQHLKVTTGDIVSDDRLAAVGKTGDVNKYLRVRSYLAGARPVLSSGEEREGTGEDLPPLMEPVPPAELEVEIAKLPDDQKLVAFKEFDVYYGYYPQLPAVIPEIGRLRELTFRDLKEGSGRPGDTDEFDQTYTQLFIWHRREKKIIGAYRMGQTDIILEKQGVGGLYLNRIFDLSRAFLDKMAPGLEMGRSFIVPEYQRHPHGLYLLWRGIGQFAVQHPRYRYLYGTVSLSNLYHPLSLDLIRRVLAPPGGQNRPLVRPRFPMKSHLPPDVTEYLKEHPLGREELNHWVRELENGRREIPVLVKQYARLGAEFYDVSLDRNFKDTPGLMLSVHLPSMPTRYLKMYLGDGREKYLSF